MNPNVLLTEGEQEFLAQEKSITDAVIKVIAVAKKENALIRDEEVIDSVVKACRDAVGKTQEFKALMAGMCLEFLAYFVTHSLFLSLRLHSLAPLVLEVHTRASCVFVYANGFACHRLFNAINFVHGPPCKE